MISVMRVFFVLFALVISTAALAAPPKPVLDAAAAIDGAVRSFDKKECSFAVAEPDCALAIRVTCAAPLFKYAYVMTIPLGKVDVKKSLLQENAGGFQGSHGVEITTVGDLIETVTDDKQKTTGSTAVLAFGASDDDGKRAKKLLAALAGAKKSCK
jgi:hypothetical protein